MICPITQSSGLLTENAVSSTKQYSLAHTPAVPGPIEVLSGIEGAEGRLMKKTGEKEYKTTNN
jgi:hypothetical protein